MSETRKFETQFFATVTDMHAIPDEKVDAFCEDLRLWLHTHRMVDSLGPEAATMIRVKSPIDRFGWIDDGEHNVNVRISIVEELKAQP